MSHKELKWDERKQEVNPYLQYTFGQNLNGFHLIFKMPNFPQSIKCHVIEEMKVVVYKVIC